MPVLGSYGVFAFVESMTYGLIGAKYGIYKGGGIYAATSEHL